MSAAALKAIETRYKGYRFRSRLEARWAVFLDAFRIPWEYEPEGFDFNGLLYLPDFRIWGSQWAEVKPQEFTREEKEKAFWLSRHTGHGVWGLIGVPSLDTQTIYMFHGDVPKLEIDLSECPIEQFFDVDSETFGFLFEEPDELIHIADRGNRDATCVTDFRRAVNAARSARFEFGENGGAS